jgi:hypothetical protein
MLKNCEIKSENAIDTQELAIKFHPKSHATGTQSRGGKRRRDATQGERHGDESQQQKIDSTHADIPERCWYLVEDGAPRLQGTIGRRRHTNTINIGHNALSATTQRKKESGRTGRRCDTEFRGIK